MRPKKLRLKLDRETIQPLGAQDLRALAGGGIPTGLSCRIFTCNPCTATTCGSYIC